jgi:KaiC/GvpD/RAD55 family RecA-like ATPase
MNNIEVYGKLIESFIAKMTSPEIGQFRLEISTFRIILERARIDDPALVKFTLTDSGKIVNNLGDSKGSIQTLNGFLQRSLDFISSLIGEELAKDIITTSMLPEITEISSDLRGKDELLDMIPEPFKGLIRISLEKNRSSSNHEEVLDLFQEVFQSYLKDLSAHTDLSAFKLKLSILREKHDLLKYVNLNKNSAIIIETDKWSSSSEEEVSEALVALFNSMVGLSTFLLGKEEAVKKATRIFQYYFEGKDHIIEKYSILDEILDGALHKKVTTGLDVLDKRMGGGIPKGSSILLISPSGIERDMLISNMLKKSLVNGSSAMWVLSKEPPRSIKMLMRSNELDPDELEENGRLRIVDWFSWRGERIIGVEKDGYALKSSKILSNLGIAINKGLRELSYSTTKVGIVHIIGPATNIFEFNQVYNFIQRLRAKFKDDEMASIFLLETDTLSKDMESRILEIFDGTLLLNKKMVDGSFKREIEIRSLAGVDFDANPIPFIIKDNMIIPQVDEPEPPKLEEPKRVRRRAKPRVKKEPVEKKIEVIEEPPEMEDAQKEIKKPKRVRRIFKKSVKEEEPQPKIKMSIPDPEKLKKQIKRVRRVSTKKIDPVKKNDIEGIDLGLREGTSENILQDAIDTIDELLNEAEDDFEVTSADQPRKRVK